MATRRFFGKERKTPRKSARLTVFMKVTWNCHDGHLTLRGCVPSFHLKQLLQELLRGIERVKLITNSVDVVSSTGVSSEQSDKPK